MDYSLTTLIVVPTAATLSTTGGSDTLTTGQVGVYIDDFKTVATAANIVDTFFQVAQGRTPEDKITLGSKKSGKYSKATKMEWYKVAPATGEDTTIVEMTNFADMKCNEHYTLTMRFSSFYTNIYHFMGKYDSVFVDTPCCDCGAEPCATLTDAEILAVLTELVGKANEKWGTYATFTLTGTTVEDFKITIETLPLEKYEAECVLYPQMMFDEMLIFPYFYKGAETSQDYIGLEDRCTTGVDVEVTQRATFSVGSADVVKAMEAKYHSYQHHWRHLSITNPNLNRFFTSFVDGDDYTFYVLKGKNTSSNETWASYVHTDQMLIVAFPSGHGSMTAFETLLEANLGAAVEYSLA